MKSTLLAVLLVAAIITTFAFAIFVPSDLQRQTALLRQFPELGSRTRRTAPFIVDPLLREARNVGGGEASYDLALNALVEAQVRLARAHEARRDVEKARRDVEAASAAAAALRPEPVTARRVESRTLLVLFRDTATPAEIEGVLERNRLRVLSGVADISLFVVEVLDGPVAGPVEEESALLWARIAELKREAQVETASINVPLTATTTPPVNNPPFGRDWLSGNDPLVRSHFTGAWNFREAIGRHGKIVTVGVLDEAFSDRNVDDLPMTFPGNCFASGGNHGTQVAAIIGAEWGNGKKVDGAVPQLNLVGCAQQRAGMDRTIKTLDDFLTGVPALRVVNVSLGYNWNVPVTQEMKDTAESHGLIVRKTMQTHPDVVLVSSAGNDCFQRPAPCNDPATWSSPFNWAALGPGTPSPNIIVVEALAADGNHHLALSNFSPMIGAIGEGLLTLFDNNTPPAPMAPSTSAAAPLVTAAVALMFEVNPNLSIADVRKNLGPFGSANHLDTLAAVRSSSRTGKKDLADLNGDGNVDMRDFQIFKAAFAAVTPGQARVHRCNFDEDSDVDRDDLKVMIDEWTDPNIDPNTLPGRL